MDLAGSERAEKTGAERVRLKEGGHISKSLLTLGTVIRKLSSGVTVAHIPYRDSKLTRILQSALGGNALTATICAVTSSLVHMGETLSTLRFASRAKKVMNHAERNELLDDRAKLKRAMKEIMQLKAQLAALELCRHGLEIDQVRYFQGQNKLLSCDSESNLTVARALTNAIAILEIVINLSHCNRIVYSSDCSCPL